MKKVGVLSRILTITILLLRGLLVSCNNFLDGGDFKEQLEKDIAYAKAKECTFIVKSDSAYGSFLADGEKKCKVGYTTEVQFTVNKDYYKFSTLEAVSTGDNSLKRNEFVEFTTNEADEKTGTYKITIKLLKEAGDILIRPVCLALPKVVEIEPKLESAGCDQDSPVKITFNKSVNPDSFFESGIPEDERSFSNFKGVSLSADGEDLSSHFLAPYFSPDKTILYIPPSSNNLILSPDGSRNTLNIKVFYDFSGMLDSDGLTLSDTGSHSYKINKEFGNQKKVTISFEAEEEQGKFQSTAEKELIVGYTIDIQFTLKKTDYSFSDFAAYNTASGALLDFVSFESKEYDDENGIYKAKVRITELSEEISGITIRPLCKKLPKVTLVTPAFESSGCDQDTTISVTFNKLVDTESFGGMTVEFVSGQENLSDCYAAYSFSTNENGASILNIPADKEKRIIPEDSDKTLKDIVLTIDFGGAKDSDGFEITQNVSHKFRVNKTVDSDSPVLTSFALYSESGTQQKELTQKDFSQWQSTAQGLYTHGDFSQNHIKNTVNFVLEGSDAKSGVKGVKITEKFYRSVSGDESIEEAKISSEQCSLNSEGKYTGSYTIKSTNDGIIRLEFVLEDYAENVSEEKHTYYVLKDTTIDANVITFDEVYCAAGNTKNFLNNYVSPWTDNADGTETITLTLAESSVDTIYTGVQEPYDVKISYRFSEDEEFKTAEKKTESGRIKYRITRKPEQFLYLTVDCSDETENSFSSTKLLPPRPEFDQSCCKIFSTGSSYYMTDIYPYNYEKYKSMGDYTVLYSMSWNTGSRLQEQTAALYYSSYPKNTDITVRAVNAFVPGGIIWSGELSFDSPIEIWASSSSKDYATARSTSTSYNTTISYHCTSTSSGSTSNWSSFINNNVSVKSEPVLSSGYYKVEVSGYKKDDSANYKVKFKNTSTGNFTIGTDDIVYLESPANYQLYIQATKNGSGYINSSPLSFYLNDETASKTTLSLTEDVTPPEIPSYQKETHYINIFNSANSYTQRCQSANSPSETINGLPADSGVGIYETEDGKGEIEYCFIPSQNTNIDSVTTYTEKELRENYSSLLKKMTYDLSAKMYFIPMGDLPEGLYTVCQIAKDKNGNSAVKCARAFNKTLKDGIRIYFKSSYMYLEFTKNVLALLDGRYPALWTYNSTSELWEWNSNLDAYLNDSYTRYIDISNFASASAANKWIKVTSQYVDGTTENSGFFDVKYYYVPYEYGQVSSSAPKITCSSKNYMEMANGIQVFADAPVLVHTFWCSQNLSSTEPQGWLNKGMETGVFMADSNCTYKKTNLEGVPEGMYYTSIIHFADGEMLMTEVRKK